MPSQRSSHTPRSPWRRLLAERSRSFERMDSDDADGKEKRPVSKNSHRSRKDSSRRGGSNRPKDKGLSTWGWLLTPPTRFVSNPLQRSASPKRSGRPLFSSSRPSNLTMFLLRLNENLGAYCQQLTDPSLANAQAAAEILDSSVATASSPTRSPAGSNSSSPSSPSFFQSNKSKSNRPALALEGEWETYISPLLLLAGAEALYGQMEVSRLKELYQTIQTELAIVKERLCDPWSNTGGNPEVVQTNQSRATAFQAATSMALALDGLHTFLTVRCRMVAMQTLLFSSPFGTTLATTLLQTCRELLPAPDADYGSTVSPMFTSATQELKAWIALLEASSYLEQCR